VTFWDLVLCNRSNKIEKIEEDPSFTRRVMAKFPERIIEGAVQKVKRTLHIVDV